MIYGKAVREMAGEHGRLHITVANTVSLKQNSDLISLTLSEAAELANGLHDMIAELAAHPLNKRAKALSELAEADADLL